MRDKTRHFDGEMLQAATGPQGYFELGMMYTTGASVPVDFVSAHKWFNLAAMAGHQHATRLRHEIAAEMSTAQIPTAPPPPPPYPTRPLGWLTPQPRPRMR